MNDYDKTLEKLSTIEKAIDEMLELRQQVLELRAAENQRQKAIEALRASEKKYRTLVENIPQKLFMKDTDGVYVFCNEKYAADLKIKPEEIFGRTDSEFFPKQLAEKYLSDDKRIMAAGQLENIEEKYVHDGQTFIVHTVKTPVKDEKGKTIGILGIFWDITEQKRNEDEMRKYRVHLEELISHRTAELQTVNKQWQQEVTERRRVENQLQEMERMYRTLLENTGTATVMIGEDAIISLANREFEKLSGYSREEVEGRKSLSEFIGQDDFEIIKEFYLAERTNLDTGPRDFEGRFLGQRGDIRDVRIIAGGVPGAKKAAVSLLDITDRKRAEKSLQTLQEKYQALVENAHEAIMVLQEGLLKFFNPKIFKISGYTEDELTSRPFKEFIYPDDQDMFELYIKKLGYERLPQAQSFRLMHKEGHIRWLENRGALIRWEGKPAILNFMTDITERKQAEEELRTSMEPFQELVSAMERILFTLNRGKADPLSPADHR